MVRLRGKSCPTTRRLSARAGEGAKHVVSAGEGRPRAATGWRASPSAGGCGVKDQVSRTRPRLATRAQEVAFVNIAIRGRNIEVSESLRSAVEEKVARLTR